MKRLILSSLVFALLLTVLFVVTAKAGLIVVSSGGRMIALDGDPNAPLLPEATFIQQRLIAVDDDPNAPELEPLPE
jgi:hypothetical protein